MDPLRLLRKDHRKMSRLLRMLEDTTNRAVKTREKLFNKIKTELQIHAHLEEAIFYPAMKASTTTHAEIKKELSELDEDQNKADGSWFLRCLKFIKDIERHISEVESRLFEAAKIKLSHRELWEIGDRMYEAKHSMLGRLSK